MLTESSLVDSILDILQDSVADVKNVHAFRTKVGVIALMRDSNFQKLFGWIAFSHAKILVRQIAWNPLVNFALSSTFLA